MSNKKKEIYKKKLKKKQKKQNEIKVLERHRVTVIGQAILFLTGTSLGVAKKSYKAKGLMSSLVSGKAIKVGSLFVIKKNYSSIFSINWNRFDCWLLSKEEISQAYCPKSAWRNNYFPWVIFKTYKNIAKRSYKGRV